MRGSENSPGDCGEARRLTFLVVSEMKRKNPDELSFLRDAVHVEGVDYPESFCLAFQ